MKHKVTRHRISLVAVGLSLIGGLLQQVPAPCDSVEQPVLLFVAAQYRMVTGDTAAAKLLMRRAATATASCAEASRINPRDGAQNF